MTATNEQDRKIKEHVKEHYGNIATSPSRPSCCGPNVHEIVLNGADYAGLGEVGIADLGLGCGTPASFAQLRPGQTVLDLGSGAGIDIFLAAKEIGPEGKAIGVDMTEEMIGRARRNAATLGVANVEFRLGEIESLPVDSGSVDRILSNCVLNLVPDKLRAFQEMYRVMKPGGMFAVSDIVSAGDLPEHIRNDAELYAACVSGAIDKEEYLSLLRKVGFTSVEVVREAASTCGPEASYGLLSITVTGRK